MFDLILWSVLVVGWFAYMFTSCSESDAALTARAVLAAVLGGILGFGFAQALVGAFVT